MNLDEISTYHIKSGLLGMGNSSIRTVSTKDKERINKLLESIEDISLQERTKREPKHPEHK